MKLSPSSRRIERPILVTALVEAALRIGLHLKPGERERQKKLELEGK